MRVFSESTLMLVVVCLSLTFWTLPADAKVLTKCEIVKALLRNNFPRSYLSHWTCLILAESGGDTRKITKLNVTSKYGLFQFESMLACEPNFDGGKCRVRCDSLLSDDLEQKNAACAQLYERENGFKAWKQWEQQCKRQNLPNIQECL